MLKPLRNAWVLMVTTETGMTAVCGFQWSSVYDAYITVDCWPTEEQASIAAVMAEVTAEDMGWKRKYRVVKAPETIDGHPLICLHE